MRGRPFLCVPAGLLACITPAPADAWAQEASDSPAKFKISGSARVRYEALTGQFRPGFDDDDDTLLFRSNVMAEYHSGDVRVAVDVWDSRAYDVDPGSPVGNGEVNALEPVQAYIAVDLGKAFGGDSSTTIQAGRFIMEIGSARLITQENFRNAKNGFTGLRLDWKASGDKAAPNATLFFTLPQMRLPADQESILDNEVKWDKETFDFAFWGGIATLPKAVGPAALDLYVFALDEDDGGGRATRNRHLYTPGARLILKPAEGAWDYEVEGAYQFGNIRASTAANAAKQHVSAGFVHLEAGYTVKGPLQPRFSAEFDYASGDGPGGKFGRFDTLFGSRSSDFGPTSTYGPLGRANIISPRFTVETKQGPWDSMISYRPAWLAEKEDSFASTGVRDPNGRSGSFAGHQVEVRVRRWLVKDRLQAELGGAALIRGEFLEQAPNRAGHGDTLYGYSSLALTF